MAVIEMEIPAEAPEASAGKGAPATIDIEQEAADFICRQVLERGTNFFDG
jgi:hypothetical protein